MGPVPEAFWQDWPRWGLAQAPRVLQRFPGGRTNRTYLIEASGQRLVLRRNHVAGAGLGIDRESERSILGAVAAAGIAAPLVYGDERTLITEYVSGEHWHDPGVDAAKRLARLLPLMERVHSLRLDLPRYDYRAHADAYWRRIPAPHKDLVDEHARMRPLLQKFQNECRCRALCHHDPIPGNIIASVDRLYLIDWEYAGMGCRAFDFAVLESHWGGAMDKPPLACDLGLAMQVYRHLCRLWELIPRG
jgi:thiamine kinase